MSRSLARRGLIAVLAGLALVLGLTVPAQAAPTATVHGTVTAADGGAPISGVQVIAHEGWVSSGSIVATTSSVSDGTYSLSVDGSGPLTLCFEPTSSQAFLPKCSTIWLFGDSVVNVVLDAGLALHGVVKGVGGVPLEGIQLALQDSTRSEDVVYRATTGSDGSYSVRVAPSTYRIEFTDLVGNRGYLDQYTGQTRAWDRADLVEVDDDTSRDFTLKRYSGVKGSVTLPAGVDSYTVSVFSDATGAEVATDSFEGSTYSIAGLAAGSYRVAFNRLSGPGDDVSGPGAVSYYKGVPEGSGLFASTAVTVGSGALTTLDSVTLASGATVSGVLEDHHGDPLSCQIEAFSPDGTLGSHFGRSDGASGEFTVNGLSVGTYWLRVISNRDDENCDGGDQFFVDASDGKLANQANAAAPIVVAALSQHTTLAKTMVYTRGPRLSGHVTRPGGLDDSRSSIVVLDAATGREVRWTSLDEDGDYQVRGLRAGSYKIAFNRVSGTSSYAAQFNGGTAEADEANAPVISLSNGDVETVNETLAVGGRISGTLQGPGGGNLAGCRVVAYTSDDSLTTRTGVSGGDGAFIVPGLSAGTYKLKVERSGDCRAGVQFKDGSDLVADEASATGTAVTLGATSSAGTLTYRDGGVIQGTITLPGGATQADANVVVYDAVTGELVKVGQADVSGATATYSVDGLLAGSYKVAFNRLSGSPFAAPQFFDHKSEAQAGSATVLDVGLGQTISNVDASLVKGGSISGRLVDSDGDAIAGCFVTAFTSDGLLTKRRAKTGTDGVFTVSGLSAGDYKLMVNRKKGSHGPCLSAEQYVADPATGALSGRISQATSISVSFGATVSLAHDLEYTFGSISGTISLPTGLDDRGYVGVRAFDAETNVLVGYGDVASSGSYVIQNLPPGRFHVMFTAEGLGSQYWDDKPEGTTPTVVTLAPGEAESGIDATMHEGAVLRGTVIVNGGRLLSSCSIDAARSGGNEWWYAGSARGIGFTFNGLSAGSYRLGFSCSGGLPPTNGIGEWYSTGAGGATTDSEAPGFFDVTGGINVIERPFLIGPGASMSNTVKPAISGAATVGTTLSATKGTWSQAGLFVTYQWKANGAPIRWATQPTFTVPASLVGKTLTVTVVAVKPGYVPEVATSNATAAITTPSVTPPVLTPPVITPPVITPPVVVPPTPKQIISAAGKPKASGSAKVGKTLKVSIAKGLPAGTKVTYQWLRNGKKISKATKSKYKLTRSDRKKKVSVKITYSIPHQGKVVVTSKVTAKVK